MVPLEARRSATCIARAGVFTQSVSENNFFTLRTCVRRWGPRDLGHEADVCALFSRQGVRDGVNNICRMTVRQGGGIWLGRGGGR